MIRYHDKTELHVGRPTGVGTRSGNCSQYTWLQFVQGINQQDSNGGPTPSGPVACPSFSTIVWGAPVNINPGIPPGTVMFSGSGGNATFQVTQAASTANEGWQVTGSFLYTGGLLDCVFNYSILSNTHSQVRNFEVLVNGLSIVSSNIDLIAPVTPIPFQLPISVAATIDVVLYLVVGDLVDPSTAGFVGVITC